MISRRGFLVSVGAGAVSLACSDDDGDRAGPTTRPPATSTTRPPAPTLPSDPFTLGVASGDPLPDRVVLWTRLAPAPTAGGGMPADDVAVVWEVADDDTFADLVAAGVASASARYAHSVHVDAEGLEPDHWYHYRFRVGDWTSPVGRTRTTPRDGDSPEVLRFGVASCQNIQHGYYNAYRDMAAAELDLVLFLGDYIYEYGPTEGAVRPHLSPEVTTLAAYRDRYGQYKGDALLQAAHARCPWVVVWDDHEVENDYAAARSEDATVTAEAFLARRAAAYQAWWEHMPVRMDPPDGADLEIFRSLRFGDLANVFMLDTRQYRSPQACGVDGISLEPACPEVRDPARTLVGDEQETWLTGALAESDTTWNILGNQVVMSRLEIGEAILNYDQWDGYPESRRRLFDAIGAAGLTNTVVVTGDIHLAGVADLGPAEGPAVATELVGTSISSLAAGIPPEVDALIGRALPHVKYFNSAQRGWCHHTVRSEEWTAEFRVVEDNLVEGSPVTVDATFVISPDRPGAVRA